MSETRGIRNNNPGNIEWGDPWEGLVSEDKRTDERFCQFVSAKWGIRALAKILLAYQDKHGLKTIREMISRWAPPNENDTEAYIKAVAAHANMPPEAPLDAHRADCMRELVEGIIMHENGVQPYPWSTVSQGLALAGVNT